MSREGFVYEGQVLFTHYGKEGETGRIEDVERFTSSSASALGRAIGDYIEVELAKLFPNDLNRFEAAKRPLRAAFTVTVERKAVKRYGQ